MNGVFRTGVKQPFVSIFNGGNLSGPGKNSTRAKHSLHFINTLHIAKMIP